MSEAEQRLNGIREETEIYCISDDSGDNDGDDEDEGMPGSSHPQFLVFSPRHYALLEFLLYNSSVVLSHTHIHTAVAEHTHWGCS